MHSNCGHFVIAVAGASGAGKSELVKALVQELGDAVALFFDDYHPKRVPSSSYPKDMAQWLAEGANPDHWDTPQMIADLQALLRGETITHPTSREALVPATFIVIEEPFGRARTPLKPLIDYVIALNTPPEVALARRILRESEYPYFQEHPDRFVLSLLKYLRIYLELGRPLYLAASECALKDCDLVLDGLKPMSELVKEAMQQVRSASSFGT
jgi:uridine kinase